MVNTHMNSCSRSLNISEMPIKSTRSYHLTPVRMAFVKGKREQMLVRVRCGEEGASMLLVECRLVQSLQKTVQQFLKNLKIELT